MTYPIILLVYCDHITTRNSYIIPFMLHDIAGLEVKLTTDREEYIAHEGPTLNYSNRKLREDDLVVKPNGLLNHAGLTKCKARMDKDNEPLPLFIEGEGLVADLFDPFAAGFYLLSRYEEYFEFEPDYYGRFEASSSIVYQHGLLETPLVNKWSQFLLTMIIAKYPDLKRSTRQAEEVVSIDVDQAYAFKHRGFKRNLFSITRNVFLFKFNYLGSQLRTIMLGRKDPFDTFHYLQEIKNKKQLELIFFFNLGSYSKYDKNLRGDSRALKRLLHRIRQYAAIGLHPSYYATEDLVKLHEEKQELEEATDETVNKSRQHFFRLLFPHTYRELMHAGIREDYTMGFASRPGFRAGCCIPFFWFDLQKNAVTELKLFPVTYMDGALAEDLQLTPSQASEKIESLIETVKQYNGYLLSIWHNHTINNQFAWKGWKEIFERSVGRINRKGA